MTQIRDRRTTKTKNRNAAVLICALACLLIVSALMMALVKSSLTARRETRLRLQMRQTEFLLDAGVMRAAEKLASSADYSGETWQPKNAVNRFRGAFVKIGVQDTNGAKLVTVTASLGGERNELALPTAGRTLRTYQFTTSVSDSSKAE